MVCREVALEHLEITAAIEAEDVVREYLLAATAGSAFTGSAGACPTVESASCTSRISAGN